MSFRTLSAEYVGRRVEARNCSAYNVEDCSSCGFAKFIIGYRFFFHSFLQFFHILFFILFSFFFSAFFNFFFIPASNSAFCGLDGKTMMKRRLCACVNSSGVC